MTDQMLVGRGAGSPFFLLSYLAAREEGASDWWFGVPVSTSDDGAYRVEYHHIHPRATLNKQYSKAEINDLANLAFISGKANRRISARSPEKYFPEVGDAELERHSVPLNPSLRKPAGFPEFVLARRRILAKRMTDILESFRPNFLDAVHSVVLDEHCGDVLSIAAFGTEADATDVVLTVLARSNRGETWSTTVLAAALTAVLDDLRDGRGTGIMVGDENIDIDGEADVVEVPMGPFLVAGSVEEWQKVLDRELADLQPLNDLPGIPAPEPWEGDRQSFPVLESD